MNTRAERTIVIYTRRYDPLARFLSLLSSVLSPSRHLVFPRARPRQQVSGVHRSCTIPALALAKRYYAPRGSRVCDASRIRVMETFGRARETFVIRYSRFSRESVPLLRKYVVPRVNGSTCGMPTIADQRVVPRNVFWITRKKRRAKRERDRNSFADGKLSTVEFRRISM